MCYACAYNPIDLLDDSEEIARLRRALNERQLVAYKAALLKQSIRTIEDDTRGKYCDTGKQVMKELKERQYKISRLI